MPSRVISRAVAVSTPGAGNRGLVHVLITCVTARRPGSYGISCSASNHADTWPGRSVSGLLSMASHKRLNSCAACSRVTAYTSLVLLVPLGSAFEDDGHRVIVRRPRVRSSPGAQVVRGADAVVVHLPDDAPQIAVGASTDATLRAGVGCPVDGSYQHSRLHATSLPLAELVEQPRRDDADAFSVVPGHCRQIGRRLDSLRRRTD